MLGEGVYKVRRISSASVHRSRARRLPPIAEIPGPSLYTVSKHFDKTLGKSDIIHSSRKHSLDEDEDERFGLEIGDDALNQMGMDGRRSSRALQSDASDKDTTRVQELFPKVSTALETALDVKKHPRRYPGVRQLQKKKKEDVDSDFNITSSIKPMTPHVLPASQMHSLKTGHVFPGVPAVGGDESAPTQQRVALDLGASNAEVSPKNSSQAVTGKQENHGVGDELLFRVSQINQTGLTEATSIWDELMETGQRESEFVSTLDEACRIWSRYGAEWARRVDSLAAVTVKNMRGLRVENTEL
jgi:hypothetical protein